MLRAALPMSVFSLCAVLLAQQVSMDLVLSLPARLGDISAWRWGLAVACTLGSFWAVAQYDALAHRALNTGIAQARAQVSGVVGIALGQTLGVGVVTGALARWRMLADLTLAQAARVSVFVSISFVMCWGIVTALTCLFLPAPDWARWPAIAVVTCVPVLAVFLFFRPEINRFGGKVKLPSLAISGAILVWAFVDTCLAGAALFVLLPPGVLDFTTFLPLFLIALGSGLLSNTPGGVGPFELVLLSAVPLVDPAPILAAILGYRIIYYAIPAIGAAVALLRPIKAAATPAPCHARAHASARSEVAVVTQNGGDVVRCGTSTLALWPTAQTMTLFGDPVSGSVRSALYHLCRQAAKRGTLPMIYKCNARTASTARKGGWRVLHIADEAVVNAAGFDVAIPARRGLRRKLRTAEKAGVTVSTGHPLPQSAMSRIDAQWQAAHGRARGGSMGRYCPHYVSLQWVGCAYVQGRLVGFVTAHRARHEWCLDIMRHSDDAPDGTMHALVHAAILAAGQAGARHFSLAAVPACPAADNAAWRWVDRQVAVRAGTRGLRQFKSAFAPRWVPRYAAARGWAALALGLGDVARTIHAPDALTTAHTNPPHNLDENYELASITAA